MGWRVSEFTMPFGVWQRTHGNWQHGNGFMRRVMQITKSRRYSNFRSPVQPPSRNSLALPYILQLSFMNHEQLMEPAQESTNSICNMFLKIIQNSKKKVHGKSPPINRQKERTNQWTFY